MLSHFCIESRWLIIMFEVGGEQVLISKVSYHSNSKPLSISKIEIVLNLIVEDISLCNSRDTTACCWQKGSSLWHDDFIKWKNFPHYWPFVQGIYLSPVNAPHKGQWHRALMFSLICAWTNGWVNNQDTGDLRHHHAHYDIIVMKILLRVGGISAQVVVFLLLTLTQLLCATLALTISPTWFYLAPCMDV